MRRRGPVSFFTEEVTRVGDGRVIVPFGDEYQDKILSYNPTQYLRLNELTGTQARDISGNAYHGTYSGLTLGQTGIGDGLKAVLSPDGLGHVDVYNATLANVFDGDEGTVVIWVHLDSTAWLDGAYNAFFWLGGVAANRYILVRKGTVNNRLEWYRRVGDDNISRTANLTPTDAFHCFALRWSLSGDGVNAYYDGTALDTNRAMSEAWDTTLASTTACLAANNTADDDDMYGKIAHYALFQGTALTDAEIADLAEIP